MYIYEPPEHNQPNLDDIKVLELREYIENIQTAQKMSECLGYSITVYTNYCTNPEQISADSFKNI